MSLNESVFLTVFVLDTQIMFCPKSVYPCHNRPGMSHTSIEIMYAVCFAYAKQICFCYWTEYTIQPNKCEEIGSNKGAETAS